MEKLINNIEELNNHIHSNEYESYNNLRLNLQHLNDDENYRYGEMIRKNKNECGCDTGGYFLIGSVLICLILSIYKIAIFDTSIIRQLTMSVIMTFVCSLIGKFIGIWYSRIKIIRTLNLINSLTQQRINENVAHIQFTTPVQSDKS